MPQFAAEGLEGLVAVTGLVFFLARPLRWFAIDWARERMFAARDQFFDEAICGHISFDDPCYKEVRRRINDNIRFAHSGSLLEVLAHVWAGSAELALQPKHQLREIADRISNEEARAIAHNSLDRVEMTSVALLLLEQYQPDWNREAILC